MKVKTASTGTNFVGYDRDKSQSLMIDAEDLTLITYFTEGWNGTMLLLTSANDKGQWLRRIAFNMLSMTRIGSS